MNPRMGQNRITILDIGPILDSYCLPILKMDKYWSNCGFILLGNFNYGNAIGYKLVQYWI